jgi:hypothetical protein
MANEKILKRQGRPDESELLIYQTGDGQTGIQVRLVERTVWLTQKQIGDLYQKSVPTINEHIANILGERELTPEATIRKFRIVQVEGKRRVERLADFYNLDMILAIGYRVRSQRGTQFRQWATRNLKEYLIKGFVLDDERLKKGEGEDYFDELLERIRAIRASERRFYQKITDIYATSIDYDPDAKITQDFYATVQNKLHFAIHGYTAAEIIRQRADSAKPYMGLTVWKRSPKGRIHKQDVGVAKNYLSEAEINSLNRVVNMYLDYAESQAQGRKPMHMADWVSKLDAFLHFNEKNILTHAGSISHEAALEHAYKEFVKFDAAQNHLDAERPVSDFDKAVGQVKRLGSGTRGASRPADLKTMKSRVRKRRAKKRAHQPLLRGRAKGRKGKKKRG